VNDVRPVLELHDLDQLLLLARDEDATARLRRMGYALDGGAALARDRERLASGIDRRWLGWYERSFGRYGRGVTVVRGRVCQGCFVTLPTSAAPPAGEGHLHLCEGCGRLLFWA
jgi:predicted  nucleic acid-binding Zn-ribbon protein